MKLFQDVGVFLCNMKISIYCNEFISAKNRIHRIFFAGRIRDASIFFLYNVGNLEIITAQQVKKFSRYNHPGYFKFCRMEF